MTTPAPIPDAVLREVAAATEARSGRVLCGDLLLETREPRFSPLESGLARDLLALREAARASIAASACADSDCCDTMIEHTQARERLRALLPEEGA